MTTKARRVIVGNGFERRRACRVADGAVGVALNQVLMRIVWKVDRELKTRVRLAKSKTGVVAGGCF